MSPSTPVTIEELLTHARWLRLLVRRMLDDPATADDVVQQTYLSALRSPPRHRTGLRGWLATVARNCVRQIHRREGPRPEKESRAARPDIVPDVAEAALRLEIQRQVSDEVLRLDEPYRSVVLLRFYEEMEPRDIARHLGVPGSTVRNRLRRALEKLRARMDEEHGGRRRWALALLPLLDWTSPARPPETTSPRPTLSWTVPLALTAMVVLVVVIGLLTGTRFAPTTPASHSTSREEPEAGGASAAKPSALGSSSVPSRPSATPLRPSSPAAPTDLVLAGRVIDAASLAPVTGAEVVLLYDWWRSDARTARRSRVSVTTDERGRFRFDGLSEGIYALSTSHRDYAPWTATGLPARPAAESTPVELSLVNDPARVGSVEGRIETRAGEPIADAVVTVRSGGDGTGVSVTTDARGTYRVPRLLPGHYAVRLVLPGETVHGGEGRVAHARVEPTRATRVDFGTGETVTGRILTSEGSPLDGIRVDLRREDHRQYWSRSNPDGEFRYRSVAPGTYRVDALLEEPACTVTLTVVTIEADAKLHLKLPSGAISGRVLRPDAPAGPQVRLAIAIHRRVQPPGEAVVREPRPLARAYVDAEGRFGVRGLPPGEYELVASPRGYRPVNRRAVVGESTTRLDLSLTRARPGRFRIRAASESGAPLPDLTVICRVPGGAWSNPRLEQPEPGLYLSGELDPKAWQLSLFRGGTHARTLDVHLDEGRVTPIVLSRPE